MEQSYKDLLNKQTHDDDSLIALIEKINNQVEKENIQFKKECLVQFLINALLNGTTIKSFDKSLFFLDTLSSMTLSECEMMAMLYDQDRIIPVNNITSNEMSEYAILGAVGRLRSYGFIVTYTGNFSVGGRDNALTEEIQLSDFGKEFVCFCL